MTFRKRRLSQEVDAFSCATEVGNHEKMSAITVPYTSVRSHRKLVMTPSENHKNMMLVPHSLNFLYKPNFETSGKTARTVYLSSNQSEAVI